MANRPKMDPADRAKQFLPFDALKGFREALAEKERTLIIPGELTSESPAESEVIKSDAKFQDKTVDFCKKARYTDYVNNDNY